MRKLILKKLIKTYLKKSTSGETSKSSKTWVSSFMTLSPS